MTHSCPGLRCPSCDAAFLSAHCARWDILCSHPALEVPVKRRKSIALVCGAAAWPLAARGQGERMRRIGILSALEADDPEGQTRMASPFRLQWLPAPTS